MQINKNYLKKKLIYQDLTEKEYDGIIELQNNTGKDFRESRDFYQKLTEYIKGE